MFAKTVLDSGIRVLSHELANTRSVSLGIWVENGSRHEARDQNGISHFIEHLLFKGTERRTAARIAEEMDAVGGVLNAFTGKEYTCYYAKVLDENLPMAIDLLTDIFRHSVFDREEIERERSVILQEISQAEDTPDDYVHDLFNLDFFKDHPLGRPI
ncbi:MAG: insulinase family protein [Deltaproteobacteria bacterium]|nr:insulinase family protein [Deltaproteobacteria bacterium]